MTKRTVLQFLIGPENYKMISSIKFTPNSNS